MAVLAGEHRGSAGAALGGARVVVVERGPAPDQQARLGTLQLLSAKPVLYVCNVDEASAAQGNQFSAAVAARAAAEGAGAVVVAAAIEAEVARLGPEDRREYLHTLGLEQPGLERVIVAGHRLLDLIMFFTAGPKEARAWTIRRGTRAQDAAGVIHSDFARGFICAEVAAWDEFVRFATDARRDDGGAAAAKEAFNLDLGQLAAMALNVAPQPGWSPDPASWKNEPRKR